MLSYGITAVAGLFVSASVVTGFHPSAWFKSVSQTAEYQFFYFNGTAGKAVIPYILSQPVLWLFTFIMIAILLYYLYLLINHMRSDRDLYAVFIILSVSAATYAYICSGSGYNFREALEVYAVLFILFLAAKAIFAFKMQLKTLADVLSGFVLRALAALYVFQAVTFQPVIAGTYIERLGGTNTQPVALVDARVYTEDEEVFSMYATGLEVVKDQFQPTGYDYIIHALGQDVQKEYAQKFVDGNYMYVQTPSMEVGSWLAQQNWYLYRHLLAEYEMDFQTEYSFIWKKTDSRRIDADVQIEIQKINNNSAKIVCTSDNKDSFVADVAVEYDTEFDSVFTRLMCLNRKAVFASTTCCGYNSSYHGLAMPEKGAQYIPVKMENGRGEAVLSGVYGGGINLNLKSAEYIQAVPLFTIFMDK